MIYSVSYSLIQHCLDIFLLCQASCWTVGDRQEHSLFLGSHCGCLNLVSCRCFRFCSGVFLDPVHYLVLQLIAQSLMHCSLLLLIRAQKYHITSTWIVQQLPNQSSYFIPILSIYFQYDSSSNPLKMEFRDCWRHGLVVKNTCRSCGGLGFTWWLTPSVCNSWSKGFDAFSQSEDTRYTHGFHICMKARHSYT